MDWRGRVRRAEQHEDDVIDPALPLELPHPRAVKKEEVKEEEDEPLERKSIIASGGRGAAGEETGGRAPEDDAVNPALPMELPPQRAVKKEEVKEEDDEPIEKKSRIACGGGGATGERTGGRAPEDDVFNPALPMELPPQSAVKKEEVKEDDDEPIDKRSRLASGGGGGAGKETGGRVPEEDDVLNPALPMELPHQRAVKKEEVKEEDDEPIEKRASGGGGGSAGEVAGCSAPAANPAAPINAKLAEKRAKKKSKCIEIHEHRAEVAAATEQTLHALLQRIESFFIRTTAYRIEACDSLMTLVKNLPELMQTHVARRQLAGLLLLLLETQPEVFQAAMRALFHLVPCMDSPAIANLVSSSLRWEGDRGVLGCNATDFVLSVVYTASRAWPGHTSHLLARARHFLANSCGDPSRIHAGANLVVFSLRAMGPRLPLNFEERRRLAQELQARVVNGHLAPLLMPVVWQLNAGGGVL